MALSDDHRQVLEAYFAYVDGGETNALLALFHPEILYIREGSPDVVGLKDLERFYRERRIIASGTHELDALLVDGDWAVAKGRFKGSLKDGSDVAVEFADMHQFRDRLIWRRFSYFMGQAL